MSEMRTMSAKLPEWKIKLDDMILGVLYVEELTREERIKIGTLLAHKQNVHMGRITFEQEESRLLTETVAEPANVPDQR